MDERLSGKTALVTGAGQGIGWATAVAVHQEGAEVWAADVKEAALAALSAGYPAIKGRRLDVADANGIKRLPDELGRIDILFNCVGAVHHGTILECSESDWDTAFNVNVRSMYRMCRAFLPAMLSSGHGNIINVSSAVSSIRGVPNRFVYGTTKAAVIGLTKAIAADYVRAGIRCNAICPGTVESPSLRERIAAQADPEQAYADFVARQPMARLGRPEEIASLATYLASDESAFTTGQVHIIDGGWTG